MSVASSPHRPKIELRCNDEVVLKYLARIHRPEFGGCFEIRAISAWEDRSRAIVQSSSLHPIMAGWYTDPLNAIPDLRRFDGVSAYVVQNPVSEDLLGLSNNRMRSMRTTTKDKNIIKWTTIYIDIDSIRPDGISATDDELRCAIDRRDSMLDREPEIRDASDWGCSGNGGWCSISIIPMDIADAEPLVAHLVAYLHETYSTPTASIDVKTKNASRIGCIAGTWKCKGEHLEGKRPWRICTQDSPDRTVIPLDLVAFCAAHAGVLTASHKGNGHIAMPGLVFPDGTLIPFAETNGHIANGPPTPGVLTDADVQATIDSADLDKADTMRRAWACIRNIPFAIAGRSVSGRPDKHGHGQTFDVACVLVRGFGLSIEDAGPIFDWYCDRCDPRWTAGERKHKLNDADKGDDVDRHGEVKARGYKLTERGNLPDMADLIGKRFEMGDAETNGEITQAKLQDILKGWEASKHSRIKDDGTIEAADDPHRLARKYIDTKCIHEGNIMIRFYRDSWMRWNGNYYYTATPREINAHLNKMAKSESDRLNKIDLGMWIEARGKNKDGKPIPPPEARKIGTRLTGDMNVALTSYTLMDSKIDSPAWLDGRSDPDPAEIMPCKNSLVHLPAFVDGKEYRSDLTPLFFNTYSLSYDFNPDADEPVLWLKFLNDLWNDDVQSIMALQEWFGYCLTADTSHQKILALIGPTRSGKDTIRRVLSSLIGECNCAGPTLSGLATNFGVAPLIGKPLAIVQDARLSPRVDAAIILERLLTISGEGALTIDRKGISAWTGKLPTRMMIVSNILPRFDDSSGALAGRLIVLRLIESFLGKEDLTLFQRMIPKELPGILLWAIEGWDRLRKRGKFEQPKSSSDLAAEMEDLGSPVKIFVRERCNVAKGLTVSIRLLYNLWCEWCVEAGRKEPGDVQNFGRNLMASVPTLTVERPRTEDGNRLRCYIGIGLQPSFIHTTESSKFDTSDLDSDKPY